jgi:hypothetical protein
MMNILDIQDKLKSLSQDQLANEMQMPSGAVPQFLVLGELNRRQSMRQSMQQQGAGAQTVAQELLNGAGVPSEGMSEMGRSMAPKSSIAQNTGIGSLPQQAPPPEQGAGIAALAPQQPMGMYGGGPVTKMAGGSQGAIDRNSYTLPQIIGNWWNSGPTYAPRVNPRDPLVEIDPLTGKPIQPPSPVDPRESNAMTAPRPTVTAPATDPFAPQKPTNDTTRAGSGSGAGGAGPMSSYEKMLQDAMANAEKKAKQDKWLALAQAGMALMSSTSGSFAGALGEAGKVGIEALQGSRDVAEQNKLKLGQEMFGIEQDRAAQARAAATSGQRRAPTAKDLMSQLNDVQEFINTINPPPDGISEPRVLSPAEQASIDEAMSIRDALVQAIGQMGVGAADLSDPAQ